MRTSEHGIEFISAYEGFVDHPYRDSGGVWTIGYGHTGPGVQSMGTITHQRARALLAEDVRGAEHDVNAVSRAFTQAQFDALVSFVFNCGAGTLAGSRSLGRALRTNGMRGVPTAMALYTHDANGSELPGLVKRRAAEGALFGRAAPEGPARWLTPKELEQCRELDDLRQVKRPTAEQKRRIARLVGALTEQRKRIWRQAQPTPRGDGHGWDYGERRHRYHSLWVRTA
jgi:lysozyme